MGLGHSNVHLGRIVTIRHKSSPIPSVFFFFWSTSKFKTTDRKVEGEESLSILSHCITAIGQSHFDVISSISSEFTTDFI